ncbi:MAG: phosphoribosylamine--glycine ligase [Trueperaceae bacterium]|nr:phosphoribosylamine--glycine ligase [Trueperaceae bacterium]
MRVLVVGSGGREHALAWKINASPRVSEVLVCPGNPGMRNVARIVPGEISPRDLLDLARQEGIDFTVVGPESPLVEGIVDVFKKDGRRIFGASRATARLEGSKAYAKGFMVRHGIPTAKHEIFSDPIAANIYIDSIDAPIVVKDSGLASGKGVTIAKTNVEAQLAVKSLFEKGPRTIVIEEFLEGQEVSLHLLSDGTSYRILTVAQDYKQAYDNDLGPMTGGMGAVAPVDLLSGGKLQEVEQSIVRPTLEACKVDGMPFRGVMFIGLMVGAKGVKVLEYNVRFGDPETQVLCPLLKSDLLPLLEASADGDLAEIDLQWSSEFAACVVMAAPGYPGKYKTKIPIKIPKDLSEEALIFHAGTDEILGSPVSAGGRVINVVFRAPSLEEAVIGAYASVKRIQFPGAHYRTDIGGRLRGV